MMRSVAPPDLSTYSRSKLIYSGGGISQVVTNSSSEAAWSLPNGSCVIPAGSLTTGCIIRVTQGGVYQAGVAQSITPRVRLGTAATGMTARTILATTVGAVSGLLNAAADTPWKAETLHEVWADGSIMPFGTLFFATGATAALTVLVGQRSPVTGPNLAVDNVLTASAQWAASMAANQILATLFSVELLRP